MAYIKTTNIYVLPPWTHCLVNAIYLSESDETFEIRGVAQNNSCLEGTWKFWALASGVNELLESLPAESATLV